MKAKIILTAVTIMALLFISPLIYGQGCCGGGSKSCHKSSWGKADKSMYGGTVKQVGKYNIEMVYQPLMNQDPLTFYLMNKKGRTLSNQEITGKVEITFEDGSTESLTLELRGENGFAGQMTTNPGSFICLLTLTINGENVNTRFDGGALGKQNPAAHATYTCPMHPEVQSDIKGSCPKCGMALEKINN